MSSKNTWFWYELMTTDPVAAAAFYTELLGWKAEPFPDSAMNYTVVSSASGGIGGIMTHSAEAKAMGAPPAWMGVVHVADAAAVAGQVAALGGTVLVGPFPIPNVGTYGVFADPTGAVFGVLQPTGPDGDDSRSEAGRVCWNELWSSDVKKALGFYQALFGWVETGSMDMGPAGTYHMYGTSPENSLGGAAAKMPEQPMSAWAHYFVVTDIDAAAATIKRLGGNVFMGPHDVPGGRIVMATDPQGAVFALHAAAPAS